MNTDKNNRFTTELFNNKDSAEKAYESALQQGYDHSDINVLMSEDTRNKYYDSPLVTEDNKSVEGLAVGGAVGGTLGAIAGAIAAIGTSLVIPGMGLVIAGPIAAAIAGAGVGSVSGGLIGALIGWGIPEDKAKTYEAGIKSGGIVLGVDESKRNTDLNSHWKNYKN